MAIRTVSANRSALARARQRRRELDRARDEQDQRLEEATAAVLLALESRNQAARVLQTATRRAGEEVRLLLALQVSAERAAALLDLPVIEVRRLGRAEPVDDEPLTERRPVAAPVSPPGRGAEPAAARTVDLG